MKKACTELWRRLKEAGHLLRTGSTTREIDLTFKYAEYVRLRSNLRDFDQYEVVIKDFLFPEHISVCKIIPSDPDMPVCIKKFPYTSWENGSREYAMICAEEFAEKHNEQP